MEQVSESSADRHEGIAARVVPAEERKLQDVYVLGCYGVTMLLALAMGFAAVGSAKDLGA